MAIVPASEKPARRTAEGKARSAVLYVPLELVLMWFQQSRLSASLRLLQARQILEPVEAITTLYEIYNFAQSMNKSIV